MARADLGASVEGNSDQDVETLKRFYENSSIGIIRSSPDGRYLLVNPAGVKMHGYDREAQLLATVQDIATEIYVDPEDRARLKLLLHEHGFVEGYECRIRRHKTGEEIWVRQNIYRVTDAAGQLLYFEGYVEDISDRRRIELELKDARDALESEVVSRTSLLRAAVHDLKAEVAEHERTQRELRRTEESFRTLIRQAGDAFFVVDPRSGEILDVNDQACRSLGYQRSDLLALTIPDIDIDFSLDRFRDLMHSLKKGERVTIVGTHRRKDASLFPVEIRVGLIDLQGETRLLALARDVSEQRQTEKRLLQAQKMEAVGQLTGGVAHDFNNLLAVIMGNAELLRDEIGQDRDTLRAVVQAALRGSELTQRLLAFSRQQNLTPQAIDLNQLVAGIRNLLARTLGATIEVDVTPYPGLWPAIADPGQVESALLNLTLNARDAMPDGGRLSISCYNLHVEDELPSKAPDLPVGDYVALAVSDTGTGMSEAVRAQAFEPFFTTKEVGKGSGLGLSMVYGFAKQSGGNVAIESTEEHGTEVTLYLPRAASQSDAEQAEAHSDISQGGKETVLVLEDDADLRDMIVRMLQGLSYRVIAVGEVAAARPLFENKTNIDLVLSDVILPGGASGPAFVEEMRSLYPTLKVIYMSGYPAESGHTAELVRQGRVLLRKPFQRKRLAEVLREVLA